MCRSLSKEWYVCCPVRYVAVLIFFACALISVAVAQPASLSLRLASHDDLVTIGDTLNIEVFVDPRGAAVTSVSAYLSFDDEVFTLLPELQLGDGIVLPFRSGLFMNGQVYTNSTAGDVVGDARRNGLDGFQVDYVAVSNSDPLGGRFVSVQPGVLASFRVMLTEYPASRNARIKLDNYGRRRSIYTDAANPGVAVNFQSPLSPLLIAVEGDAVSLTPISQISDSVLATSAVFLLNDGLTLTMVEDGGKLYLPLRNVIAEGVSLDGAEWSVRVGEGLKTDLMSGDLIVTFPPDWHGDAVLDLQVTDRYGRSDETSIALRVTPVNDAPLVKGVERVRVPVGGSIRGPALADFVIDVDDAAEQLSLIVEARGTVEVELRKGYLWFFGVGVGLGEIGITVVDASGERADGTIEVEVVNLTGAPEIRPLPEIELERGTVAEIRLNDFVVDNDTPADLLRWSATARGTITAELIKKEDVSVLRLVGVIAGTGQVALQVTDTGGNSSTGSLEVVVTAPKTVSIDSTLVHELSSNGLGEAPLVYPNPFNSQTAIRYELEDDTQVRLVIYDLQGRPVRTLIDHRQAAGAKTIIWDGRGDKGGDLPSGTYFYRMGTERNRWSGKMTLVR